MNHGPRIELTDTPMSMLVKLSEENPGALTVCVEMLKRGAEIDPMAALGGLSGPLALDTHGIYGSRIWTLYKDVCGQDITSVLAVLRAVQLGLLPEWAMLAAIDHRAPIDMANVLEMVRARLGCFAPETKENTAA